MCAAINQPYTHNARHKTISGYPFFSGSPFRLRYYLSAKAAKLFADYILILFNNHQSSAGLHIIAYVLPVCMTN